MLTEFLLVVLCLVFLYFSFSYATYRPKGFPPGPPRIPLFGSYLFMMMTDFKYLHKAVLKFSKWYKSDIVGLHMGHFRVVIAHSSAAVHEILYNNDFDGRPQLYLAEMRSPGSGIAGIFFKEGPEWKEQRRFLLRYLRDFGFGRRFEQLELVIKEEITDMIELMRGGPRFKHEHEFVKPGGYRVLLPMVLNPTVCNSYFYIMLNERYNRSEQENVIKLIKAGMVLQRVGDDYGKMISIAPWLRYICPGWSSYTVLKDSAEFTYAFFKKFVDYQLETFDDNSERNFIDIYLREMKAAQEKGDAEARGFNTNQFIMALADFAFPAFTAVGTQISLLIQYFLLYPDILKKVQAEIDEVCGRGRLPGLEDRQFLHYTEATVREILRIETLVPSDIPHKAVVDTTLMGYNVPKDTIVIPSLYAYHNDKRVWQDPENFRPERFLTPDGKLSLKLDVSFPFGAGKRLCAGETFARNMLFLLTSSLCQNFNFVLAPGDKKPEPSKNLSGLIISPEDFWVQLEDRN